MHAYFNPIRVFELDDGFAMLDVPLFEPSSGNRAGLHGYHLKALTGHGAPLGRTPPRGRAPDTRFRASTPIGPSARGVTGLARMCEQPRLGGLVVLGCDRATVAHRSEPLQLIGQ
jgi:hypothetical protein